MSRVVLLVDNDELTRRAIAGLLALKKLRVLQAADCSSALELIRVWGDAIHILVFRTKNGANDGWEWAASTSARHPELKILLISDVPADAVPNASWKVLPESLKAIDIVECVIDLTGGGKWFSAG